MESTRKLAVQQGSRRPRIELKTCEQHEIRPMADKAKRPNEASQKEAIEGKKKKGTTMFWDKPP